MDGITLLKYKIVLLTTDKRCLSNVVFKLPNTLHSKIEKLPRLITVLKSPFIFKSARQQFFFTTFKGTLYLAFKQAFSPIFLEYFLFFIFKFNNNNFSKLQIKKLKSFERF